MRKFISALLKIVVIVFAVWGTALSAGVGDDTFMGGKTAFMYFTIQSNLALALLCFVGLYFLLRKNGVPEWWYVVKFVGTMSITITGLVFCFMLAPLLGRLAWAPANVFTHVIVPVASVLDFFIVGLDSNISRNNVLFVPIPPIIYAVYAGIGFVRNWNFAMGLNYPYFFLDWGSPAGAFGFSKELPFMGCAWWILALLIFLILGGLLYLWILNGIKRLHSKRLRNNK